MTQQIRLLQTAKWPGARNMAADEVLLQSASEHGVASLRFYQWSEPTVSLGYFQAAQERLPGLPWVRRSTGGAALVHDHEVTYALALPAGRPWQIPGETWICRMHHLITTALIPVGVQLRSVLCGEEKKLGSALCFLHQTPGDLIHGDAKVVGSAQRKQKGALLQHGGILLSRSEYAPELPGILDLTGMSVHAAEIMMRVQNQFSQATGWKVVHSKWDADELQAIDKLEREKYASVAWNEKR